MLRGSAVRAIAVRVIAVRAADRYDYLRLEPDY